MTASSPFNITLRGLFRSTPCTVPNSPVRVLPTAEPIEEACTPH